MGGVLDFQGSPDVRPAKSTPGTLHALDLGTRTVLRSFTPRTEEVDGSFGHPLPVDNGLWVDAYKTLLRLR